MKDLDIIIGWKIDACRLKEIKNTILGGIVKAGLNKAMFCTAKDKVLRNDFIQKVFSDLLENEGVLDSWSKDVIIALIVAQRTNAIKQQNKLEPRSQT